MPSHDPAPSHGPAPSGSLLFVLAAAMGVGPLINYGVSSTGALLVEQLGISDAQLGLVVTVVFAAAAVASLALGRLADRLSFRAQLWVIFGGTAAALVVASFAEDYWVLLAAALLAGPCQAISNPTTNRVVASVVPAAKRPGWIGIKQSGVQASQLFAGLFFPAVALWLGWRGAALGAALVAGLLLAYALRRVPASSLPASGSTRGATGAPAGTDAGRGRAGRVRFPEGAAPLVWLVAAVAFFSGLGAQATNVYLPLFAVRELGFPLVLGGAAAGVAGIIGVASRIGWSRRLAAGARASTLLAFIALGALGGAAAFVAAGATGEPALLWLGVALHGAAALGTNVIAYAAVLAAVPRDLVGSASGVVSLGMYAGFALGPLGMGLLLEASGHFTAGWVSVGAAYALCLGAVALLRRRAGRR